MKSKTKASLLAIFLGSFGIHHFYLRSHRVGLIYLLFSWTLIPGIIGIIEGIRYILMDEDVFLNKYTQDQSSTGKIGMVDEPISPKPQQNSNNFKESKSILEASFNINSGNGTSQVSKEEKYRQAKDTWIPIGKDVTVNGYNISDGMVYVGKELAAISGYGRVDSCLINPSLEVDSADLDPTGTRMSYWPSYSNIDSGCRATYLNWLAEGRRDPNIDIGYVFLFFYGLERRIFFDAQHSSEARSEIPHLLNEIEELRERYPEESSFQGYSAGLLDAARAQYLPEALTESVDSGTGVQRDISLGLRMKIGRQIVKGDPIDAELAYEWFLQTSKTRLRTPAKRCENEFKTLFIARYTDYFDGGLSIDPNKTSLNASYNPASQSLPQQEIEIESLPDVSALSAPQQHLQKLANECCDELDAYSRYVGKNEDRDSLKALAFLPKPVLAGRQTESLTNLLRTIEAKLGTADIAEIKMDYLLDHWFMEDDEKVRKRDLRQLSELLEKLGFGIEPDVRFAAPSRGWKDPAVLFRLPAEMKSEKSEMSDQVRLIQKLAVKVVLANNDVAAEQTEYIADNLGSFLELNEANQVRLEAHRRWLILDSPTLHGVRQRTNKISKVQKNQIAEFLTALACSDGRIESEEIQELSKIYSIIGLDEKLVHTHLHQLKIQENRSDDEPVTIRKAKPTSDEYEIPPPKQTEESQTTGVKLDQERVSKTLEESREVREFLADIFEEDDAQSKTIELESELTSDINEMDGLDKEHQQFLNRLTQRPHWEREEVEELAHDRNLFAGAAIEVINDYAFEQTGAIFIEGTEEIEINQDVASEITE